MKKIFSISVLVILILAVMVAAQEEELPDAGTTPDSALYGLDKAFERISLALTFNKVAKAEKRLQMASERLAELKAMTDNGKPEYSDDLADGYDNNIKEANEISKIAQGLGKDTTTVDQLVAKATSHHLEVLAEIYEKVPEQAKAAIEKAMNKSARGRETAVAALKKKNALGDISEEIPAAVSEKIPEKVKEKIGIKSKLETAGKPKVKKEGVEYIE